MKVTDQMETAQKDTAAETTLQSRYYISSMAGQAKPCWRPPEDIGVSKTACIVRKDHGTQNLAVLRQIALKLLKQETTLKRGIQGKRHEVGWLKDYPLKVLLG